MVDLVFSAEFGPKESWTVGCVFNDNKTSELHNLEILKWKKKINKPS